MDFPLVRNKCMYPIKTEDAKKKQEIERVQRRSCYIDEWKICRKMLEKVIEEKTKNTL